MTANLENLHQLTYAYKLPAEDIIMSHAVAHLVRGGIRHEIVWNEDKTEAIIWSEPRADVLDGEE